MHSLSLLMPTIANAVSMHPHIDAVSADAYMHKFTDAMSPLTHAFTDPPAVFVHARIY